MRLACLLPLAALSCAMTEASSLALDSAVSRGGSCLASGGCQPLPPPVGASLRGRVLVGSGLDAVPVSFAKIELLRDGRYVASTTTDGRGAFSFTAELPDGPHELVLAGGDYAGRTTVLVDGQTPDVVVFAIRKRR